MAYKLTLPQPWNGHGWKAKIRDRERVEPPHVTIIFRHRCWRLGLRDRMFLDDEPDPGDVPTDLLNWILEQWPALVRQWDLMYPENPVTSAAASAGDKGDDR